MWWRRGRLHPPAVRTTFAAESALASRSSRRRPRPGARHVSAGVRRHHGLTARPAVAAAAAAGAATAAAATARHPQDAGPPSLPGQPRAPPGRGAAFAAWPRTHGPRARRHDPAGTVWPDPQRRERG